MNNSRLSSKSWKKWNSIKIKLNQNLILNDDQNFCFFLTKVSCHVYSSKKAKKSIKNRMKLKTNEIRKMNETENEWNYKWIKHTRFRASRTSVGARFNSSKIIQYPFRIASTSKPWKVELYLKYVIIMLQLFLFYLHACIMAIKNHANIQYK